MQLEQEVDLILGSMGMFMQATDDWTTKWAPAVLEYGYTLTGKKASMVLTAQKTYESMHIVVCIGRTRDSQARAKTFIMYIHMYAYTCITPIHFCFRR